MVNNTAALPNFFEANSQTLFVECYDSHDQIQTTTCFDTDGLTYAAHFVVTDERVIIVFSAYSEAPKVDRLMVNRSYYPARRLAR